MNPSNLHILEQSRNPAAGLLAVSSSFRTTSRSLFLASNRASRIRRRLIGGGLFLIAAVVRMRAASDGSPSPDAWGVTPPQWLTEASFSFKEGYDTDIFGTTAARLPGDPNVANVSSAFTVFSPKAAITLLPFVSGGPDKVFTTLALGYAGDYAIYRAANSEKNLRNNFTQQIKGKSGPWSASVDNSLIYVAGSTHDVIYATYSPLGYAAARERREQIQERGAGYLRYDAPGWFVRSVANTLYYNLLIDEHNPVGVYKGYVNWVNRDDINTGFDFGLKVASDFSLIAGWRLGQQTQARLYYSPADDDNTYNRALVGFEGKIFPWLQVQSIVGPDHRRYSDGSNVGLTDNRHTWVYLESAVTANVTNQDSLTYSIKVWHFVSSGGGTSFQETTNLLNLKHAFTKEFSMSVGWRLQGARYDAPSVRNDWLAAYPVNLTYAFNRSVSVGADYSPIRGRSHVPVSVAPGRDWDEKIASLSVKIAL